MARHRGRSASRRRATSAHPEDPQAGASRTGNSCATNVPPARRPSPCAAAVCRPDSRMPPARGRRGVRKDPPASHALARRSLTAVPASPAPMTMARRSGICGNVSRVGAGDTAPMRTPASISRLVAKPGRRSSRPAERLPAHGATRRLRSRSPATPPGRQSRVMVASQGRRPHVGILRRREAVEKHHIGLAASCGSSACASPSSSVSVTRPPSKCRRWKPGAQRRPLRAAIGSRVPPAPGGRRAAGEVVAAEGMLLDRNEMQAAAAGTRARPARWRGNSGRGRSRFRG
jgi:hypothetical protein